MPPKHDDDRCGALFVGTDVRQDRFPPAGAAPYATANDTKES